jgi:hypothetical protein
MRISVSFSSKEPTMTHSFNEHLRVPGTDLEITINLEQDQLTISLNKTNAHVYRVVIEQATMPIEHAWLSDLFMHDHRVRLSEIAADLQDYVESLDLSQG